MGSSPEQDAQDLRSQDLSAGYQLTGDLGDVRSGLSAPTTDIFGQSKGGANRRDREPTTLERAKHALKETRVGTYDSYTPPMKLDRIKDSEKAQDALDFGMRRQAETIKSGMSTPEIMMMNIGRNQREIRDMNPIFKTAVSLFNPFPGFYEMAGTLDAIIKGANRQFSGALTDEEKAELASFDFFPTRDGGGDNDPYIRLLPGEIEPEMIAGNQFQQPPTQPPQDVKFPTVDYKPLMSGLRIGGTTIGDIIG